MSATGRTRSRLRLDHPAHFGFALPPTPVLPVQLHESRRPVDRFLFRPDVEDRVPADDLLRFVAKSSDGLEQHRRRRPEVRVFRGLDQGHEAHRVGLLPTHHRS
jgi:hypothetical protein